MLMDISHEGEVFVIDVPGRTAFRVGTTTCLVVPNAGGSPPAWFVPMPMVVDCARAGTMGLGFLGSRRQVVPDLDGGDRGADHDEPRRMPRLHVPLELAG